LGEPAFAPQSDATRIYAALWAEMEERMAARPQKAAAPPGPWVGSAAAATEVRL
jgi:hypothetical protein